MKKRDFAHYVNQNPELKKWLVDNQDWVMANPKTMKQMIKRWGYVQSLQSPSKGMNKVSSLKMKLPKVNLDTISQATQQLGRTMGMVENMKNIIGLFGPR